MANNQLEHWNLVTRDKVPIDKAYVMIIRVTPKQ